MKCLVVHLYISGGLERLPIHTLFSLARSGTEWVISERHIEIHICPIMRLVPEQARLWERRSRHRACVGKLHHIRRELKAGKAEWRLIEKPLGWHCLSLRARYDGDGCGNTSGTLLQATRCCIPRGRRGLHLRGVHAERSGPTRCLSSNGATSMVYRLRVWRRRQPPRRLDWRQREVRRSEVIDMEFWVMRRADLETMRRGRPIYGRGDGEGRCLGRRLLPIDLWSRPGVEEVRVRKRLCSGRLQRRVRGGGLWCGGGTGKVPVWGSDETVTR